MWLHILIFAGITGFAAAVKLGWLKGELFDDKEGRKLFLLAALAGNMLGMLVTLKSGMPRNCDREYAMERETAGPFEKSFLVSVDGGEADILRVQIPEKELPGEAEEPEAEPETAPEEQWRKELQDVIIQYNQEKNDPDYYYLPDEWEGKKLIWQQEGDSSGYILAAMALVAAFVLLIRGNRQKQEEQAGRREQLFMDYPALVMKFTLLVQAGMTVRKAFEKIAYDYSRSPSGKKRFAYEEIAAACCEMDSGVSEAEAYRRFGERCGHIKYKTLATLLIQNLQKGSRHMADMLEKESMEAWDERRRKARVLGEAAATKLLVPMMLMLGVVMAIVIIPAFLSFYG